MVKLEMEMEVEKSGEPMSLSETPTQLGVSVPMGGKRAFAASARFSFASRKAGLALARRIAPNQLKHLLWAEPSPKPTRSLCRLTKLQYANGPTATIVVATYQYLFAD